MHSPLSTGSLIVTLATPRSVRSSGMTASAPAGIGAPVMMRTDNPGPIPERLFVPATTSPVTGSWTGLSGLAARVSTARTA